MSLRLIDVGHDVADRSLFDAVTLTLADGERLALVGENGAGKTTLLRLAAGLLEPSRGRVQLHGSCALLDQLDLDAPASEATLLQATLIERYEPRPGVFDAALRSAGLDPHTPPRALSGGERQRARLAALLAVPAEHLFLDEPTNHLDSEGRDWLVERLRAHPAAMLLVDHDRAFLDAIAERTAFLAQGALRVYPGGYHRAAAAREADEGGQLRRHRAQLRHRRELREAADRQRSKALSAARFDHRRADGQAPILAKNRAEAVSRTHARASAAMRTRLEREQPEPKPFEDRRRLRFQAARFEPGPQEVIVAEGLVVERGGRRLVAGLTLHLRRGERVALAGPNGSGKTTLLEVLLGIRPPTAGSVRHGIGLASSYVAQADARPARRRVADDGLGPTAAAAGADSPAGDRDVASGGTPEGTPLGATEGVPATVGDLLRAERPDLGDTEVWEATAAVGAPNPPERPLDNLSGGELQRLEIARLAVTAAHLLVLDEPTLHLDVRAIEALEGLLLEYPGTLLLVSHDRALVERVTTRRLSLDGTGGWELG